MRRVPCPHPGKILLEEFLKPMGITQYRLAKEIGVPQRRIGEIVAGKGTAAHDSLLDAIEIAVQLAHGRKQGYSA